MANKKTKENKEHPASKDSRPATPDPPAPPETSGPPAESQEVASHDVLLQLAGKMQHSLLNDKNLKVSLAEYLKLVQLIKDMEGDQVREITVRWVDPLWAPDEVA